MINHSFNLVILHDLEQKFIVELSEERKIKYQINLFDVNECLMRGKFIVVENWSVKKKIAGETAFF